MDFLRAILQPLFGTTTTSSRADEAADELLEEEEEVEDSVSEIGAELEQEDEDEEDNLIRKPAASSSASKKKRSTPSSSAKKVASSASPKNKRVKKSPSGDTPGKSMVTSAMVKGKWSFVYSRASEAEFFTQDKDGAWYEVKPLDVIGKGDARAALVTHEDLKRKRGVKAKPLRPESFVVSEGDWVRVHFQGWNDKYDEWILFEKGGFLCPGGKECLCARHGGKDTVSKSSTPTKSSSNSTPRKTLSAASAKKSKSSPSSSKKSQTPKKNPR
jgi:hypothetical protein